jgi:hypothetical protein
MTIDGDTLELVDLLFARPNGTPKRRAAGRSICSSWSVAVTSRQPSNCALSLDPPIGLRLGWCLRLRDVW